MNKLFSIKEKIKNNNAVHIGVAFVCCVVVLAVLLILMPKGYAANGSGPSDAIVLSVTGRQNVETGKYYRIPSGTYTSGVTLDVTMITGKDVYIILDNATFNITTDEPAIEFTKNISSSKNSPSTAGDVTVHLILEGTSKIESTCTGALSPLIKVENYSYVTDVYKYAAVAYEQSDSYYYSQTFKLEISEADSSNRNSLTLITAKNSYGAAIGTAEAQKLLDSIDLSSVVWADRSSFKDTFEGGSGIDGYGVYTKGVYLKDLTPAEKTGETPLSYGAADVIIKSGVVNVIGNGYGAGIGNGGSKNASVNINSEYLLSIYGKQLTANLKQSTGSVKIAGGTVSVIMAEDSKGSCFMNSSYAGSLAEDGKVTIDGGSVYLKRQGDYSNPTPYSMAVNSSGEQLFLYEAEYQSDIANASGKGTFTLKNVFTTEREYQYTINKFIDESDEEDTYNSGDIIKYLDAEVSLGEDYGGLTYDFNGYYHDKQYSDSTASGDKADKLYFYLPAIRLNIYNLKIEGNASGVQYSTVIKDSLGTKDWGIIEGYPYTLYPGPSGIDIKEKKYACIRVTGVPSYCEEVKVTYVQTSESGVNTFNCPVYNAGNGTYYTYTDMIGGNVVVKFDYIMGKYTVNYDYGLLPEDAGAVITNPNPTSAECGTTLNLSAPTWENHQFEGWYLDSTFTNPITNISSNVLNDTKTVYAKWSCKVNYITKEGTLVGTNEYKVSYGDTFDILDSRKLPAIDLGAQTGMIELAGWECNGKVYGGADTTLSSILTVHENMVVEAQFKRSGYYVYITATYNIHPRKVDIMDYATSFQMIYANNASQEFNPIDTENYYRTVGFVDKTQPATVSIVPKEGYKIVAKSVTNVRGENVDLIAESPDLNQFSFNMPEQDVYISITFEEVEYSIKYYDIIDGIFTEIDGSPNPDTYTVSTPDFEFVEPSNTKGKYYRFKGFKEFGTDTVITGITKGTAGNLVLVADWEEVEVYDIVIENNDMGTIKAYVDGRETTVAMAGEQVKLVATAGNGVRLIGVKYEWTNPDGSITSTAQPFDETNTSKELTFTMPEATVNVSAEFEAIEYLITYLNLHSATNTNPTTYTIFDSFELDRPEKEGWEFKGWQLITPDWTTEDENDVIRTDITRIENRYGNLMLYADWEEAEEESNLYYATVDEEIVNGQIELTKNTAEENEYVFVKVSEKEGYKLKSLVYNPTQRYETYATSLERLFTIKSVSVDISINQVAEGLYYFIMPRSDVEVTALFEPIKYNIIYNVDGGTHTNVTEYTIEDDVELTDAEKEGYIFEGWYDENGKKIENISRSFGDITLLAKWQIISDTSSTDNGDGTIDDVNEDKPINENDSPQNDDNKNSSENETDTASQNDKDNSYLSSGSIKTGDSTNIMKLVVICVICAVLLFLFIPKKKDKEDEENQQEDIEQKTDEEK